MGLVVRFFRHSVVVSMWIYWVILFSVSLVLAALIQCVIAVLFTRYFLALGTETSEDGDPKLAEPSAAILMSVRGADPSLIPSVSGALSQTHSNYQVHVVVDHDSDPAWEVLQRVKKSLPTGDKLHLHVMSPPSPRCGLKCHSLVQAVESLPDDIEHVALLDADVVPQANWLENLTRPLRNPEVGGVTGAQWFEPSMDAPVASWWRSVWNAGAMIPTIYYANPWAGSFSIRLDDLKRSGLLDAWKRSIVDDGPIRDCLDQLGKRIVFAPALIMINRENCGLDYVSRWTTRMLTWSRLHESTFWLTQVHAYFSNFVLGANIVILITSIAFLAIGSGSWLDLLITCIGLIAAGALCVWAYISSRTLRPA